MISFTPKGFLFFDQFHIFQPISAIFHRKTYWQNTYWHDGWKAAHKDHPRYPTYNRYPYAMEFAAARLDERPEEEE